MTDIIETESHSIPVPGEKLQKVLARVGLGSRREVEGWISAGRVTVNSKVAELGCRVDSLDQISVDGRPLKRDLNTEVVRRVMIYNKPEGEVCTRDDPERRPDPNIAPVARLLHGSSKGAGLTSAVSTLIPPACCYSPLTVNWPTD